MDEYRVQVEIAQGRGREDAASLLRSCGLDPEGDAEITVLVRYEGTPAATASLKGDVVKEVAAAADFEGEGLAALAVSRVIGEAHALGRMLLRVYTKSENEAIFKSLGFTRLASSGRDAILLESDPRAFKRWAAEANEEFALRFSQSMGGATRLAEPGLRDGADAADAVDAASRFRIGSVVVNCNPFTRGHRSLIERAAARCDRLLVFVLSADKSSFPSDVRLALVRRGVADLANVTVLASGPYLISEATFPTYFIKEKSRATEIHARLDLDLFATKIAPAFGIKARFMGTEPYCEVTNLYNSLMKEILPAKGIAAVEVPRLEEAGVAISASSVRAALRLDDWEALDALVPETTLAYLRSPEAAPVIERIKTGNTRH